MKRNTAIKITAFSLAVLSAAAFSSCRKVDRTPDENKFSYETQDAPSSGTYGGFSYTVSDGEITLVLYHGDSTAPEIPAEISGMPVVAIANEAAKDNTTLQKLVFPASIKSIGSDAFHGCTALSEVTVGANVARIGSRAFDGSPWLAAATDEFFVVGDGVLLDYNGTAEDVTIPDGIRFISSAFCASETVRSVTVPDSVTVIGDMAFNGCTALESVSLPPTIIEIGFSAFARCTALRSFVMPDSVQTAGDMTFMLCTSLESITLSGSLTAIPVSAFLSCSSLTEIAVPDSVTSVGETSFAKCTALTTFRIGSNASAFGELVFSSSAAEQLTVICPDGSPAADYCARYNIRTVSE